MPKKIPYPLQDWINEHAWGSTWQREGVLPRKYRSLITLAMLTALKSPTELKGHVRGALNNGCTVEEIQKLYCTACHIAAPLLHKKLFVLLLEVIQEYQQKYFNMSQHTTGSFYLIQFG